MGEIKPYAYYVGALNAFTTSKDEAEKMGKQFPVESLYPAAAYEAKCNEVAQLQKENVEIGEKLHERTITSGAKIHELNAEVAAQVKRIAELEIEKDHLQFLLDSVMLEHCPDEMTEEQMENWKNAQRVVNTADPEYYKSDTYKNNTKFSVDMIK